MCQEMFQVKGICLAEVINRISDKPMPGEKCETDVGPKHRAPQRGGGGVEGNSHRGEWGARAFGPGGA